MNVAAATALVVLAASAPWKLLLDRGGPLWFDEAWTGAIVSAPTGEFGRQLGWDVNPPFYFLLMRGWSAAFGLSASALRAPSLLASLLTPFIVALTPGTGLSRTARLAWAALLAVWTPDLIFAHEARGYALLVLLEAAASVTYLRWLDRPSVGRAWTWAAVSCLAMLTHYHATVVTGLEALLALALLPRAARASWSAGLAFLPWLAWTAPHLGRVLQYARPEYAWYGVESGVDRGLDALAYLAGGRLAWEAGLGLAAFGAAVAVTPTAVPPGSASRTVWALPTAGLAGAALVILGGYLRPSFTERYLLAFGPAAILGAVLLIRDAAPRAWPALLTVLLGAAVATAFAGIKRQDAFDRRDFNFQTASEWLLPARPARLVFLWDNPTARVLTPGQRRALGGFFFRRAGEAPVVDDLVLAPHADANLALLAASAPAPGRAPAALIWVWDYKVTGTLAIEADVRMDDLGRDRACRRFAEGSLGVVACAPPGLPAPPQPQGAP